MSLQDTKTSSLQCLLYDVLVTITTGIKILSTYILHNLNHTIQNQFIFFFINNVTLIFIHEKKKNLQHNILRISYKRSHQAITTSEEIVIASKVAASGDSYFSFDYILCTVVRNLMDEPLSIFQY